MNNLKFLEKNVDRYIPRYVEHYYSDPDYYKKYEGYKFKAVDTFRKNFNLEADDFVEMLEKSFADAHNLIQSGQYYPKNMLIEYAEDGVEFVREKLNDLLFADKLASKRVEEFIKDINDYFQKEGEQSYLDYRFLSFILASYDHSSHFYIKWNEYTKFADLVGYNLGVNLGSSQGQKYDTLSSMAQAVRLVLKDSEAFQKMHKDLVSDFNYKDPFISWGTWDFIFNAVRKFSKNDKQIKLDRSLAEMEQEREDSISTKSGEKSVLKGKSKKEILDEARKYKPGRRKSTISKIENRNEDRAQKNRVKKLENYRCQVCEDSFIYENANGQKKRYVEVDHIVEYSEGGTEELDNLWTLCPTCHAKKTLGVITVDKDEGVIKENGEEINIKNNHLSWYKD